MMTSKVLLVADRVLRDSESGNLSIINILEDIIAESYPIVINRLTIVAFLIRLAEEEVKPSLYFKLYNNENLIGDHQVKIDFRDKLQTRAIIQLGSIQISNPGQAHFVLTNQDGSTEIDRYTINLKIREEIKVTSE